jgi:hypothetical protein
MFLCTKRHWGSGYNNDTSLVDWRKRKIIKYQYIIVTTTSNFFMLTATSSWGHIFGMLGSFICYIFYHSKPNIPK